MTLIEVELSKPQRQFIFSKAQFPAFVAGYGCVHPDTKIWTERGLIRIADISGPIRVLSWDENSEKFVLSLSGGSFPKGMANLRRVVTSQGEFVSTEHHRVFSSNCTYQPVGQLSSLSSIKQVYKPLLSTILAHALKEFPIDGLRWSQKDADCLCRYADAARQYGQQFLEEADTAQASVPLKGDAHKSCLCSYFLPSLRKGGQEALKQEHNRLYQFFSPPCSLGSCFQRGPIEEDGVSRNQALSTEHTLRFHLKSWLYRASYAAHHIAGRFFAAALSPFRTYSSNPPTLVNQAILKVLDEEVNGIYYDMQVLNTNNYVCEHGFIHHNSGKSHAAILRIISKKLQYPKQNVAYYLPTYDLVARAAFPRVMELCDMMRIPAKLNKNEAVISIEGGGEIIFRTMDNPDKIVAYEVADSVLDELDTLKTEKAAEVWHKAMGRNRQKKPDGSLNTMAVATTPEGFRFVYERWARSKLEGYELIKASTYSNRANLPEGYIESLKNTYPSALLAAYLDGEFVNLTSGSVYPDFDRELNKSHETIQPGDDLHVGMDFNVGKMASVFCVTRDGQPHAVAELTDLLDTPAMIAAIKQRYDGHRVFVYPDASGNSRKSNNASESDIALLRAARFTVLNNSRNPAVKDRVLSVNAMLHKDGVRRFKVNIDKCPFLVESLEKQAYDKHGEPDKTSGHDHVNDAIGYYIAYKYPVAARPAIITRIGGL